MAFNTAQSFKRLSSNAGATALGGMARAKAKAESYLANAALGAIADYEASKLGADAVRYQGQKAADSTMFGAWAGAIGNVLGSGLSAGIKNWRSNQANQADQANQGLGRQATYGEAKKDAWKYGFGSDGGYGGVWTGGGTPDRRDYPADGGAFNW